MSGRCMPVAGAAPDATAAEPPAAGPRLFFVYWRSQRRQFFSFRARVAARTAREARARFRPPRRGPEPVVVGVKQCAAWEGEACAGAGRWVG